MRIWAVSLCYILLGACASAPAPRAPDGLFVDRLFAASSERISAGDVFALSDEMKVYLGTEIARQVRSKGARQGLVDAIAKAGELKLEYDSMMTRNAAEAFASRSGNCLSLVIMTAAFAKALELPARYQSVLTDETVSRIGDIQFYIGHVNLTLAARIDAGPGRDSDLMTIDFLPSREAGILRSRAIGEESIVAMYMNNRAAEKFTQGQIDDAYWWARAAIGQDPRFVGAYNTLGIIYHRHGNLAEAERAFAYAMEREPFNTRVMSNLVRLLDHMGRAAEAKDLASQLKRLEPNPPFTDFDRGMAALGDGDPGEARDLFAREVNRAPYYHEFRFWLGVAYVRLGEIERARKQFQLAVDYATTRKDHDLYAAKLDRIRATRLQ